MTRECLRLLSCLVVVLLVCACARQDSGVPDALVLTQADFGGLSGWAQDDHAAALGAFRRSCARILRQPAERAFGPLGGRFGDWHVVCRSAVAKVPDARAFFETHFQPWQVWAGQGRHARAEGLFTGYYEPLLRGSRTRGGAYQTPLRKRPDDLVMVDLGAFRPHLKGERIAGRVQGGQLVPYETRSEIVLGALAEDDALALMWVDDPVDAFFLHIQGSGVVSLDTGEAVRVGYAGQNGHVYYAIGRELVARGALAREDVSLQSISAWLRAHPESAQEVMNTNASYVFFTEISGDGSLGGENVPLTPERSLAIDRSLIAYGIPVWVDIAPPVADEPFVRRLMVAQDTGGAIRGAVRGDVFWGRGARAEYLAGHMKSQGRYWLLLPRGVDPQ